MLEAHFGQFVNQLDQDTPLSPMASTIYLEVPVRTAMCGVLLAHVRFLLFTFSNSGSYSYYRVTEIETVAKKN